VRRGEGGEGRKGQGREGREGKVGGKQNLAKPIVSGHRHTDTQK